MNKKKEFTFEPDVFETFYNLSIDLNISLKDLINNVLRAYIKNQSTRTVCSDDPISELLTLREKERKLLKEIKELDLLEELSK
ncbi:MAG: hypothetical protein CME63_07500 [Halobacteriovoraceae bacterium]|jgi:hypothetical protein|nr:hypothetical protein [Halobacteriovoraceae bacterium]MBC97579.1 hypothetical protein [Halobacteriovoraceae bacterium]MCR9206241.1 hypothetical protein [Halobacteriovoraceae bacterium]|tara:strand:- start:235 stop:483 length:249 start_codon:yes stop_codon:yes gene_type:complete